MQVRVSVYDLVSDDEQVVAAVEGGLLPILSSEPGFVSYSVGLDQDGRIVVVNEWESGEEAEQALAIASEWVAANTAEHVSLVRSHLFDDAFARRR